MGTLSRQQLHQQQQQQQLQHHQHQLQLHHQHQHQQPHLHPQLHGPPSPCPSEHMLGAYSSASSSLSEGSSGHRSHEDDISIVTGKGKQQKQNDSFLDFANFSFKFNCKFNLI